jgi:hypothetical protein
MVLEPDRYLISLGRRTSGLFGLFVQVLKCLSASPELTSVVYWGRNSFCYWSDQGWHGALNGWEYYFEPVSEHSLTDLLRLKPERLALMTDRKLARYIESSDRLDASRFVLMHKHRNDNDLLNQDGVRNFRQIYGQVISERIRVKQHVLAEVNGFWHQHLEGERVIGIHYRSTDKPAELAERSDPTPSVSIDDYLDRALALDGAHDARFFLATEDELALERARQRLGNRLVSTQATRSRDSIPPHLAVGGPRVGQEALVDCLLLARCHHLVHGVSNLSHAALLFSPEMTHSDMTRIKPPSIPPS